MDSSTRPDPLDEDVEIVDATFEAMGDAFGLGAAGFDVLDRERLAAARGEVARNLVSRPARLSRRAMRLGAEQLRIALGTSDVEPDPKDRRFADDWFASNPLYRRLAQSHIANERAVAKVVDDLDLTDGARLQAELASTIAMSAVAPTNHLLGNPAALKEAWRTRGQSLLDGARNAVDDARHNGGMPSMVDTEPFTPGDTIAATPGAVVYRHDIFELIRYTPTTAKVHKRPVFVVPPQINKYYVLDLAPGRSMVEHLVSQGQQVFLVSWRNPGPEHRDWDLDAYVSALLEGIDATLAMTNSDDLNLLGVCAGGITSAALAGYLAAIDDERLNTLSLLVTVLDWSVPSTLGSMVSPAAAPAAKAQSAAKGILAGDDLARTFAWLRPNDLVWNYWVNNYLQGHKPPAYDVLAWNVDSTNLPAGLHHDFMDISAGNSIVTPGELEVLGERIDLSQVEIESFVVGAITDHITPWTACYKTVEHLGGSPKFVLSSQGHIQALVNPSGNPRGSYRLNDEAVGADADEWLEGAATHGGSWWDHWTEWLSTRSGRKVNAPKKLGTSAYPEIEAAPGSYVRE